ncbi:glycosyltransferase family 4 protein [Parabacteroides goldsteinii]|nr:glycosyltransferase family 4 protein [Parabacteroides goldsteinii]
MKNRVILTMIYDIKLFPPVISICNILSELNYEIVYIGGCSDINTEEVLMEKNRVRFYKTSLYGGNGIQRIIQQYKYRKYVLEVLKSEYVKETTYLWLLHSETVSLFSAYLDKYDVISHLFEFKNPTQRIAYRLLSPCYPFEKNLKKSKKVVCCEYNRAHITKSIYNLNEVPYILPNKPYNKNTQVTQSLPSFIQEIISKYRNKRIILYQGVFIPERRVDYFIRAVNSLPDDYVLFLMGGENSFYDELRNKYQSDRIVFLPFLPPPLHLEITKLAYIGILVYVVNGEPINRAINVLYCAPNKLYEYSMFGIPMISNNLPALNFIFSKFEAGICTDILFEENVCESILEISRNYESYSKASVQLYNSVDMLDIVEGILRE